MTKVFYRKFRVSHYVSKKTLSVCLCEGRRLCVSHRHGGAPRGCRFGEQPEIRFATKGERNLGKEIRPRRNRSRSAFLHKISLLVLPKVG